MINHSFFAAILVMIFTCITMKITRGIGQNKNGPIMGRIFFEELPIPPRSDEVLDFCCCSEKFFTALRSRFIDAHSTTKEVYYDFVLRSDSDESVPFASIRRFCLFWSYPVPFTNFCSTSSSGCLTKTVWLRTTHATMPVIIIAIMTIIPPIFKIFLMITSLTSKSNVSKTL